PDERGRLRREVVCGLPLRLEHQSRILLKDGGVEVAQLGPRLDPEALHELGSGVSVRLERFGLPAGSVEGEHELRAKPLPSRRRPDELLELRDQLGVAAEGEVDLDALYERGQVE